MLRYRNLLPAKNPPCNQDYRLKIPDSALAAPVWRCVPELDPPPDYTCNTMVRHAPPGYGWKSIPVDSACTIHLLRDSKLFQSLRPRSISIKTASNVTELARSQGAAIIYAYTDKGVQAPIMMHDAAHAPQMADLLSVSRLIDKGYLVNLHRYNPHIVMPDSEKIKVRRQNGLFLIDYLVPLDSTDEPLPTTLPTVADAFAHACGAAENALTGSEPVLEAKVIYPT